MIADDQRNKVDKTSHEVLKTSYKRPGRSLEARGISDECFKEEARLLDRR
jgi:hypothetical protein